MNGKYLFYSFKPWHMQIILKISTHFLFFFFEAAPN